MTIEVLFGLKELDEARQKMVLDNLSELVREQRAENRETEGLTAAHSGTCAGL
jgi:hypothetical protein